MRGQIPAEQLLERASQQAEGAELYELRSLELPVRFRAGALESVKAVETAGRALRVIQDGRLGFSTTTDLSDAETLIQNALEAAQFGDPAPFAFPTERPVPAVAGFDPEVEGLKEKGLIALGEEIADRIKAYDSELQVEVAVSKRVEEVRLLNTSGLELSDRRTLFSVSVEATRAREGDIFMIYDGASSRRLEDVDGLALAERIVEKLRLSEKITKVDSKAMPVVFSPRGAVVLLLPLMVGLNGRQVFLGTSPLKEKLDQQAFDARFSLIDDGRLEFAPRSAPYDDEGVPTTRKALIDRGVVRQFLYDLKTAAQAGAEPTGNGFKTAGLLERSFRRPPGVAPTTWLVPPGDRSLEQILSDLDEALLVEQVIGLGQGNVIAGEFSNNVSVGFRVRRGEIVGRVKNTMIAGNVYELLRDKLIAVGDRAEWVFGMLKAPALAVDGVGVAGKG